MSHNKVILANPQMCSPRSLRLPLSVLSLGAVLEGRYEYDVVDGNMDPHAVETTLRRLDGRPGVLALTVMPGPQVVSAIALSEAVRARHPQVPIVWGGYFPTLYPNAAVNAPYVDYVVRGQGEDTLLELLERLPDAGPPPVTDSGLTSATDLSALATVAGLTFKDHGRIVHNPDRDFRSPGDFPPLPYERVAPVERYLVPSFMGTKTAVHQAAIGCRYRCTFCGVVSMFNGLTRFEPAQRLEATLKTLRGFGANAVQYYDNNFFDREATSLPILEVLAKHPLPWWCYARADTLVQFSRSTWELMRKSQLRMAYIGAEAASDDALKRMKKGSRVEHTLEVAARCREYGVIPEFSFILGDPEDPEGSVEETFRFITRLKRLHPQCEVILYFLSPTPQRSPTQAPGNGNGPRIPVLERYGSDGPELPTTPEEWTEAKWINYVCHRDAPWLTEGLRRRIADFSKVLACRYPTVQDYSTPAWGKWLLRTLSSWRYATGQYNNPRELQWIQRLIPLRQPQNEGL